MNGYVYILGNHIEVLPLASLRVIRGQNLYRARVPKTGEISDFSLYIALNNKENSTVFGLKEVQLSSLYGKPNFKQTSHFLFVDQWIIKLSLLAYLVISQACMCEH